MGRKRRNREEWVEVVGRWRASGQSCKGFAARLGVSPSTLSWWAWELGRSGELEQAGTSFVAVEVAEPSPGTVTHGTPAAVIERAGTRLEIASGADPRWVAAVMMELSGC